MRNVLAFICISIKSTKGHCRNYSTVKMSSESSQFKDFSFASKTYNKFRPQYPDSLFEMIVQKMPPSSKELAIDIGAGTGQATYPFSKYFKRVIGFDPSPGQLVQTTTDQNNVEFKQGTAEKIDLPNESVDLIVSAQAVHWFDLNKFFNECNRLLKPNGVLAIWGYAMGHLDNVEADNLLQNHFSVTLGPYWDAKRKIVDNHYREVVPNFGHVQRFNAEMSKKIDLDGFMGYLQTWSSWSDFKKAHPDKEDPLVPLYPKVEKLFGKDSLTLTFPIFVIYVTKV